MKPSINLLITVVLILLLLPATVQSQNNESNIKKVVFGSYSFKSSKTKEYTINSHREVLYTDRLDKKLSLIGELSKSDTKKLFRTLNESSILSVNLNKPGRDYYFIELINEDNSKHRIVWESNPGKEVEDIYNYLEDIVTSISSSNETQAISK
ncbi:MAG TPA: hypothetical protein VIK89_01750 [Cytophagaceae bacterium]